MRLTTFLEGHRIPAVPQFKSVLNQPVLPMNILKLATKVAALLYLTLGSAADAQSVLLQVKIGATAHTTATGDGAYQEIFGLGPSYWNEYGSVSSLPFAVSVVNTSGAIMPGATLTVESSTAVGSLGVSGNPSFLMNTMAYQNPGGVFNISLSGLFANTKYEFFGFAADPTHSAGAKWTVTTGTFDSGVASNDGSSANIGDGPGKAYSDFFVTTDGYGNLAISDAGAGPTYPITVHTDTILQGFALWLQTTPEPGTWALALSGCGIFFIFQRFKTINAGRHR
jgi:hypothetical protein